MSLLEVDNLSIRFDQQEAVRNISFSLDKGERLGIVGESGSGKTLTSLAIAGLLPPNAVASGAIALDEKPLPSDERTMARLRGQRLGMVFQEPMTALNPLMRVAGQIGEAVKLSAAGGPANAVDDLLIEVGLTPSHGRRYPHELSGGQRQRVMIAMALASRPDILIADEPTSALDLITQRKVLDLIAGICAAREMALIFISHDLKAVAYLCSRVLVMQAGELVERGEAKTLLQAPQQPYTRKLVAAARYAPPAVTRSTGAASLLQVDRVTRDYRQGTPLRWGRKTVRAVDQVSFSVEAGECLALVGPSGCGKTTLARVVAGLDRATDGELRLGGQTYHGSDLPKQVRRDVSLVFQDPFGSFNPHLTIGQSVGEPLRLESGIDRRQRLTEAVEAVGLQPNILARYPHEFSGGQRQRLAIARALIIRPKLVILDEPVSALDMSLRGEVLELLQRLQADYGLSYLLISHDLDVVHSVADRVMIMQSGRILEQGRPSDIFARPQHEMTRALLAARLPEL